MKRIFLAAVFLFTVPANAFAVHEKATDLPKLPGAAVKADAIPAEPVVAGSDLMEGTLTALAPEGEPTGLVLKFTSGQKAEAALDKSTTVFFKDKALGTAELSVGNRVRVEYVTKNGSRLARNIEIIETSPEPASSGADEAKVKPAVKKAK